MISLESFSIYIILCVLAPLIGAFTLLFLFIFEKRIDLIEKEKKEIAIERELQMALYNQLNQEIQPHFLFNTLNSILSLARLDRKKELVYSIETFSKLLKFKYQTNTNNITVNDELTYIKYYLEIQKTRFRDRLFYEIEADEDVHQALIIPFLIQTLVENAFKHSFEKHIGEAFLKVTVKKCSQSIQVTVWNSANNQAIDDYNEVGIGLENIKARLHLFYSKETTSINLLISETGTTVVAVFPYITKE
ncbi:MULTISPECIES: sensor histidine kinase [Cytobacillus]|uniref:Histidine kinase n=1 Tax=Cytobacillus kochii TaxID=859143 RepID=A0A248TFP2_9BACI|nr:histidine kinase [Cytobacillus kochii]ASV67021.1 histidine kinase [Cytobacillus kochii]MCA1029293.1 histidine kinase [Cytobacillus kochii]MCM3323584.1 histidine kinase [Cytobacillus kochii]MCM3345979.1 histidine kinase [Cytobacillus kochii]